MHVQPLVLWRSILPLDIPSITAACSVMAAGPALSAFAIFQSSECAAVVNVPGGNGAVAEELSSAKAVEEIATNPIMAKRVLLTMRTSLFLPDACSHRYVSMCARLVCGKRRHAAAYEENVGVILVGDDLSNERIPNVLPAKGLTGRRHQRLPSVPVLVASSPTFMSKAPTGLLTLPAWK